MCGSLSLSWIQEERAGSNITKQQSSDLGTGLEYSQSQFVADECINPHPRFGTLTRNIRMRRGSKVDIRMPLFRDTNTAEFAPFRSTASESPPTAGSGGGAAAIIDGEANLGDGQDSGAAGYMSGWEEGWPTVDMDCMAFGMGMCCLQVTFQAKDVNDSRYLYDQLASMTPIMLALTAATPIMKGRLLDSDARWAAISQSVDDRTPAERGSATGTFNENMAGGGIRPLAKSRYDSISSYLCSDTPEKYNDIPCEVTLGGRIRIHNLKTWIDLCL